LAHLQGPILEIGRTCVDPAYRNGGTIAVLWGELAEVLNQGGYSYLMGCASIPMQDGGIQAHAIMQRLRERYLCTEHLRAEPKKPLPTLDIPSNVIAEMPPLLKAYMRLGAKICGEPCWDEDFPGRRRVHPAQARRTLPALRQTLQGGGVMSRLRVYARIARVLLVVDWA
jgi:putative hemolysin